MPKKHPERNQPPINRKELFAWLGVLGVSIIIMGCLAGYLFTHWDQWGRRSYPEGRDIRLFNVCVEEVIPEGNVNAYGEKVKTDQCYVWFGSGTGGIMLDSEWADRFTPGETYNLFLNNRDYPKIDRIVSYQPLGRKS